MIMKKVIYFTLLCLLISLSKSQICQVRTSSNITNDVCCADYEKRENECIACSKGYTSYMGQNCKPCMKNIFGERCRYACSCLDFEVCDNVEGCVNYSSTTGISVYATSSTFVQSSGEKTCGVNTERGTVKKVCCADFEEKGKGCIACSRGYTSNMGQKGKPCQNKTYGEKCRYECSCSRFESCDHVDGCVEFSSTTGTSVDASSYVTSSYREENTNKQCTGCSNQGLLSREFIVYTALSVLVIGCGICSCFVFLKYKILTKKYIVTVSQTRNLSIPQQIQPHEIADRLYDIINDEDLLDDLRIQQMQMPSNYLDVIHDSNTSMTRESCESNRCVNLDNPCQLLTIDQTQNQENNLRVDGHSLTSGDNTSSSDEYQWDSTQDYLNPYQPMIEILPPVENKYLTIATAHSIVDGNYKDSATEINEYELQHPRIMEMDVMANLHD